MILKIRSVLSAKLSAKISLSQWLLLSAFSLSCLDANAATIAAASCSFADVSTAISTAVAGDTVTVPAGSCAWSTTLNITKGLSLIGNGAGKTILKKGDAAIITYRPSDAKANALFRISGFTFDFSGKGGNGIELVSGNTLIHQTKIRVDNNRFQNIAMGSTQDHYIYYAGIYGVIDSNFFGRAFYPFRTPTAQTNDGGRSMWNNWQGIVFGAPDNNMYFEDNVFEELTDPGGVAVTDCQEANRYAFRYNTINLSNGGWSLFDMHGNNFQQYACFGGEIYGNHVIGGGGGYFLDQRGGRVFVFNNSVSDNGWAFHVREEQEDATSPVTNPSQYPQHVNGSYYWGNKTGMTGKPIGFNTTCTSSVCTYNGDLPLLGRDFFTEASSPGISCGPLSSRPPVCQSGQAFWATSQSCSDLTGMVGARPLNPISGTLYRCTASNVWDSGTAPLPYPHPLRGASPLPPILLAAPGNLRIVNAL